MKWTPKKRERYTHGKAGVKGRKNNNQFEINDYTEGFSCRHLGWWVSVADIKTDKRFNSLWQDIWFKDIEEAKQWCEDFTWDKVKKEEIN